MKKNTVLILLICLLLYACNKPNTIIKEKDYIRNPGYSGKKDWCQYYLISNPPSDALECHKLILKYADSIGISLDSLKKTDITDYHIWFYKKTIWGKIYHYFTNKDTDDEKFVGGVSINTYREDSSKWRVWLMYKIEDEYEYFEGEYLNKIEFLDLMDEYNKNKIDNHDPRVQYYQALQEQKKKKP